MSNPLISIPIAELFGVRTVVMIEVEPQSNKYCQIMLSKGQYLKLTKTLKDNFKNDDGLAIIPISREKAVLPEKYKDYYLTEK